MREILFRALDKVHNDIKEVAVINWVEQTVLLWNKRGNVRITIKRNFDDIELMQYTGLTDKKGTKIYEGDIIKYHPEANAGVGRVIYEGSGFYVTDEFHGLLDDFATLGIEVIGNIYDNPELAEGGEGE